MQEDDEKALTEKISRFISDNEIDEYIAGRIGWYVYGIFSPTSTVPFYIGKGKGARVLQHLKEALSSEKQTYKLATIRSLFSQGSSPRLSIIRRNIESEELAYLIESCLIDVIRPEGNLVLGHDTHEFGMTDIKNIIAENSTEILAEADITEPLMFIKIDRLWEENNLSGHFDAQKLYDITRGFWRVNRKRAKGRHVCAVAHGVIREIYEVFEWNAAEDIEFLEGERRPKKSLHRFRFTGFPTDNPKYRKYANLSVKHLFKIGEQSPVTYWPRDIF
tara:strand:+ start:37 stop:864 length:828 start_codon:yes stop_codon:yes gene_type:complete